MGVGHQFILFFELVEVHRYFKLDKVCLQTNLDENSFIPLHGNSKDHPHTVCHMAYLVSQVTCLSNLISCEILYQGASLVYQNYTLITIFFKVPGRITPLLFFLYNEYVAFNLLVKLRILILFRKTSVCHYTQTNQRLIHENWLLWSMEGISAKSNSSCLCALFIILSIFPVTVHMYSSHFMAPRSIQIYSLLSPL